VIHSAAVTAIFSEYPPAATQQFRDQYARAREGRLPANRDGCGATAFDRRRLIVGTVCARKGWIAIFPFIVAAVSVSVRAREGWQENLRCVRHHSLKAANTVGLFVGLSQNRSKNHEQIQLGVSIVGCPLAHHIKHLILYGKVCAVLGLSIGQIIREKAARRRPAADTLLGTLTVQVIR
jgi:hypothetical protein